MNVINEHNFLIYLKKNYSHLYNFQMEIERVINSDTGYGEVWSTCIIRSRKIFSDDVGGTIKSLHVGKEKDLTK